MTYDGRWLSRFGQMCRVRSGRGRSMGPMGDTAGFGSRWNQDTLVAFFFCIGASRQQRLMSSSSGDISGPRTGARGQRQALPVFL